MDTAEERLWMVTPYLVMDGPMRDRLTAVCAGAPGDTKILVNSREAGNNIIASADYTIHRPMAERLGVPLWEFQGDWSMHTKSVLVDHDLSIIGSFNFDPRSAYLDTELMLAVYSRELNAQLAENMDSLLIRPERFSRPRRYRQAASWVIRFRCGSLVMVATYPCCCRSASARGST